MTSDVKGQIERKISKSKNLQNFDLLGALEIKGYGKLRFLLQKAHPCVNPRRLSHFAWKSVEGVWPLGLWGKKTQKVSDSHRNDVSPLTQGLRYRAACEKFTKFDFGWGSAPDPVGGAYSAPPDPLAGLMEPTSTAREGREKEGMWKEEEREGMRREGGRKGKKEGRRVGR